MELSELFGAVGILKESIKLLPKNCKLIALITLLYFAISSVFFWIYSFSAKSVLSDMVQKLSLLRASSPGSSEYTSLLASIKEDLALYLLFYFAFVFAFLIISCFSTIATILISALSYSGKLNVSIKNLLSRVLKSWARPLVTVFYTSLLVLGYHILVLLMVSPLLIVYSRLTLSASIAIGIVAYLFYLYLSVPWVLALVISVLEEDCFGIQALGKAGVLLTGKRLHGFVLHVFFNLVALIFLLGFWMIIGSHKWLGHETAMGIFVVCFSCLLQIFHVVAFTVLYFHCKKNHGEDIELQDGSIDSLEYIKISTAAPLVDNVLP